ncbi:twin-arginine translocase TatA/TatE family subunit [Methylobacterium gnaphalii]|uniref:Sec-independent protein translocase protein TatA n=1 Tax=Methylobacterium gnaphalii TaxID=1010610 RepID=A0A512JKH7_9HYPH|nr:twin-arginine translocase TatA/TatE family subunit [Methylobacterium gnaphalii]GEP10454.1 Sec-independent protein translocase protein TatA [Methylobacterium gnaphalii]GJD70399.1 Sec-independent protein translocase protein TatA [Methylobacterium gnaphalii]GLS47791.1 Sec-independent protein translocase protein TatA [Methylobacterium gnaphalii]
MGSLSIWHWIVVAVIVMMLFGRGKVSELMGDVAKGIKAFKKGMAEDDEAPKSQQPPVATMPSSEPVRTIPHQGEPSHAPAQSADHRIG